MKLTYATAPRYATNRAAIDVGEHRWDHITLQEQNDRTAHHLNRLWRILDGAHRNRQRIARAERAVV